MICSEMDNLLSAHVDGELPSELRTRLSAHAAVCPQCTRKLRAFHELSRMASQLDMPPAPPQLWQWIESQLDGHPVDSHLRSLEAQSRYREFRRLLYPLILAAALLVAVGLSWLVYEQSFRSSEHHQLAVVFDRYFEAFGQDPATAQQFLLARYPNRRVVYQDAIQSLGYRPIVAAAMPPGYENEATYVMQMPCCACTQSLCTRADGTRFVVFEHDHHNPGWFGGRPTTRARCGATACELVTFDNYLAARWKMGERHITIIGAKDRTEVDRLVTWFDDRG